MKIFNCCNQICFSKNERLWFKMSKHVEIIHIWCWKKRRFYDNSSKNDWTTIKMFFENCSFSNKNEITSTSFFIFYNFLRMWSTRSIRSNFLRFIWLELHIIRCMFIWNNNNEIYDETKIHEQNCWVTRSSKRRKNWKRIMNWQMTKKNCFSI